MPIFQYPLKRYLQIAFSTVQNATIPETFYYSIHYHQDKEKQHILIIDHGMWNFCLKSSEHCFNSGTICEKPYAVSK